ncbi:MAG: tRNA 2-selenouridine(34) synthase MnmH [Bacteroidota bacterium]
MQQKIGISDLLRQHHDVLVVDVRTPAEFAQAHIHGAINIPLFSNEERVEIGKAYKRRSKQIAIKIGLDAFGPKMRPMVDEVELQVKKSGKTNVVVHCWRGGMRSAAVQWLYSMYGLPCVQLVGGYKAYRRWCLTQLEQAYQIKVIGGKTGSGKTHILAALKALGGNVVCLETLANHRGSAYGGIGQGLQPRQEMFENELALALYEAGKSNAPIFVEDESQRVGNVHIPKNVWQTMRNARLYYIDLPFEQRLQNILGDYGGLNKAELQDATKRISKRLGFDRAKQVNDLLEQDDVHGAFSILLQYYDKEYTQSTDKRENLASIMQSIHFDKYDASAIAQHILSSIEKSYNE